MLDYKNIIIKHYALSLSGSEIARQLGASKSGVNDFLRAFDKCESLSIPFHQVSRIMELLNLYMVLYPDLEGVMKI